MVCFWDGDNSTFIVKAGRYTGANTLYRTPLLSNQKDWWTHHEGVILYARVCKTHKTSI